MKKYLLILLSFLIYIPSANYLIQAWESSRLDSYDWIFYLLTIPAAAWSVYKNRCEKSDWKAVFIAVPALIAALLKNFHYVNALSIIGCAVFVWSTTFCLLSAALLRPAFAWNAKFILSSGSAFFTFNCCSNDGKISDCRRMFHVDIYQQTL